MPKAPKAAPKASPAATPAAGEQPAKPRTKTELIGAIAKTCELTRAQVESVLDELTIHLLDDLTTHGKAALPGVCALKVKSTPARLERSGRNPFTGEAMTFAAKPAGKKLTIKPSKAFALAVIED